MSPFRSPGCTCCDIAERLEAAGALFEVGGGWTLNANVDTGPDRFCVVLQAQDHVADLSELSPRSTSVLGALVRKITAAIKARTGAALVEILYLNAAGHVHLHLVPRFQSDPPHIHGQSLMGTRAPFQAANPNELAQQLAADSRVDPEAEPHRVVSIALSIIGLTQKVSPYRWFGTTALPRLAPRVVDAAPVYVIAWAALLTLSYFVIDSKVSTAAAVIACVIALWRYIDLVPYQLGIILDRRQNLLQGFERSVVLLLINVLELSLIGAMWMYAIGGGSFHGRFDTWTASFSLATLTNGATPFHNLADLAQCLVTAGSLVLVAGGFSMLLGLLAQSFRTVGDQ